MMRHPTLVLTLTAIIAAGAMVAPQAAFAQQSFRTLATIHIDDDAHNVGSDPVSVDLPSALAGVASQLVYQYDGKWYGVPHQIEPAMHGRPARLWIQHGRTSQGRNDLLLIASPGSPPDPPILMMSQFATTPSPVLTLGQGLEIHYESPSTTSRRTYPVLQYNHRHGSIPSGIDPVFYRSGFIHPVYTPNGRMVTDNMPPDHAHHKGLWSAWVNTEFEGRAVDFWNIGGRTGTVQFAGYESFQSGPIYTGFRVRHDHIDMTSQPHRIVIEETWDVRVLAKPEPIANRKPGDAESGDAIDHPTEYIFDLQSTQTNVTTSPLKLLQYRYGGLGVRFAREWVPNENYNVLTSEGRTFADAHTTRARWVAHSGDIDGSPATVVVMGHPANERYPETIRSSADFGPFFNYAPVQIADWTLEPGQTWSFRYRFYIYDGPIDADRAEAAFQQFANPPKATIEVHR